MLSFHPLSSQETLHDSIIREGLLCKGVLEEDARQQHPKATASARPLCLLINRGGPARERYGVQHVERLSKQERRARTRGWSAHVTKCKEGRQSTRHVKGVGEGRLSCECVYLVRRGRGHVTRSVFPRLSRLDGW
jgi:hypothetical protein